MVCLAIWYYPNHQKCLQYQFLLFAFDFFFLNAREHKFLEEVQLILFDGINDNFKFAESAVSNGVSIRFSILFKKKHFMLDPAVNLIIWVVFVATCNWLVYFSSCFFVVRCFFNFQLKSYGSYILSQTGVWFFECRDPSWKNWIGFEIQHSAFPNGPVESKLA